MNLPTFETWATFFASPDMIESIEQKDWESVLPSDLPKDDTVGLLIEEAEIIVMSLAPVTKDIQFFHHFTKIGGSRIRKDTEFFVGLQGFGSTAQPVIIDTEAVAQDLHIKAPKGADVITFLTVDDVMAPRAKTCKVFKTKPFVLIPPAMASFVTTLDSHSPADVFISMLGHMKAADGPTYLFDEEINANTTSAKGFEHLPVEPPTDTPTELSFILRWLWSAAHDIIPCVQSVMASPNLKKVQTWCTTLHSVNIRSGPTNNESESTRAMQDLSSSVQALSQATQLGLTQPRIPTNATPKHCFEKFPDAV